MIIDDLEKEKIELAVEEAKLSTTGFFGTFSKAQLIIIVAAFALLFQDISLQNLLPCAQLKPHMQKLHQLSTLLL